MPVVASGDAEGDSSNAGGSSVDAHPIVAERTQSTNAARRVRITDGGTS
jgi:hypothetical protein